MAGHTPWVPIINLANSIIGVGVLAMPWCFNKCGVLLACLLLLFSAFLTYTSCMLLLRAAKATKRTSYENLAYHVLGGTGKMAVELCIIGLLICSCVSFFIIIGDLGPAIISKWFALENTPKLRALLQMFLAVTVVVPLGLKRSVESLAAVSGLSMIFYICFTADMFLNSLYDLSLGKWTHEGTIWNAQGGFVCITITTIAFSCQTVLFTIYESMADRTIKKMQEVVKNSVTLVTTLYFVVGLCGYVTYYKQGIKGDVLLNFKPSLISDIFKMCFTLSVALSFPLVIFPCRSSLYSMFYSQSQSHSIENPGGGGGSVYIPPGKFHTITFSIIIFTLSLGIIVQNVETVLALTGATLGSFICFILPAIIYIKTQGVANKGTAKFILVIGLTLTVIGLYHNLQTTPNDQTPILEPDFENPRPGHFKEPIKKLEEVDKDEIKAGDVHIEPPNPHPPVDIVPKEKIEKDNPKDQDPIKDAEKNDEEKSELLLGKDEGDQGKKDTKDQEKEDAEAGKVIEQLKEKQVEQDKKIEAQAEEIEILKKQHDEEELERNEKEKQERLEKEKRERKERKEKRLKEHEEMVKEKKDKEDAAIIEKAKEVIDKAAVLQVGLGLPQVPVGDQQQQQQQLGNSIPLAGQGLQDNAAFGGQLQQQQQQQQQQQLAFQPAAQMDQLAKGIQTGLQVVQGVPQDTQIFQQGAQGLPAVGQGLQQGGFPALGQGGMVVPQAGMAGQGIQPGGLGGLPVDQGIQPGGLGGLQIDQGIQPGGLGGLPIDQGIQPGGLGGLPIDQGIQPGGLGGLPIDQGIQPGGLGGLPIDQGIQPGGLGGLPIDQGIQPGGLGGLPIDQGIQPGGLDGLPIDQGIRPGGLGGLPIDQGIQPGGLGGLPVNQGIRQGELGAQQGDGNQLENVNQRQQRAAIEPGSQIVGDKMLDVVNKNVVDPKVHKQLPKEGVNPRIHHELSKQKKSNSKAGGVEQNQKSTLAGNVKHKDTDVDLQLDLAPHDDDTANNEQKPVDANAKNIENNVERVDKQNDVKDDDAEMQLEKAVVDDADKKDTIEKAVGDRQGGKVEEKKKVEM